MAVETEYANADQEAGKRANPAHASKAEAYRSIGIREVVAGASNASIYKMFANLNPELILADLLISCDAFGAGGLMDIGIWPSGDDAAGFVAIDDNAFASAIDISSALARTNGMAAVDPADLQKKLWEIAGHTLATKQESYDIGIILDAVGATGAGTIALTASFAQG